MSQRIASSGLILDGLDADILRQYQISPRHKNYVAIGLKVPLTTAYDRLRKMHKKGFCKPLVNIDWKYFGLRDNYLEVELRQGREKDALEDLEKYKGLQFYSLGQSDADVIWATLLDTSSSPAEPFFDKMRDEGLIKGHRLQRTGCHFKTQTVFSRYDPRTNEWDLSLPKPRYDHHKREWVLDSEELRKKIEDADGYRLPELYSTFHKPQKFDTADLFIISSLVNDPAITLRHISDGMKASSEKMSMTLQAVKHRVDTRFDQFRPYENSIVISYAVVSPLTFIYQHRKIHILKFPDYERLHKFVDATIELPFIIEVSAVLDRPQLILQTVLPEDINPFLGLPSSIISSQRTAILNPSISNSIDIGLDKCFDEDTGKWSFY